MSYILSAKKQFEYYRHLGEGAMAQISNEQLLWKPDEKANSIAIIIKHLHGNMLSRWTNFLTEDGEKDWRKRDDEFEEDSAGREQIMNLWNEGWQCLFGALNSITDNDLEQIIYIRNEGHSILDAINRQLAHYSYHVGEIVYISRMLCGESWKSLSIPRGDSQKYNTEKFSQEKKVRHFTDGELGK